jgi:hypothetical protein|tara:strand:+ start:113 stop:412 length:300 start_codon:yes stop_codon:yes gene_type:complete
MEWLVAKLGGAAVGYAAGGAGAVAIAWILKKIPNSVIKAKFGRLMYGLGVTCTLGLSKWKFTKKFWNKTIEPWIIDAIDNIVASGIKSFCDGMRSDNEG